MSTYSVEPNPMVTYKVRYADDDLLVVDKPAKIVTQPGLGHDRSSLLNGLFAKYGDQLQNLGKARDFGLLHRLDRETSGLLLIGLRPRAYDELRRCFVAREVRKFYWALTAKAPVPAMGVVKRPIHETESGGMKLAKISSQGKPALTAYRVLQDNGGTALVECRPVTGRLHQVRVHLKSIHAPILGDGLYAPDAIANAAPRLALHAHRVTFRHPVTGAVIDIRSPWPVGLRSVLKHFGLERPEVGASTTTPLESDDQLEGDGIGDHESAVGEDES